MNGGSGPDRIVGGFGADILRGQEGNESNAGEPEDIAMFGFVGNDDLFGGRGDDGMAGEEGSDEHYGGPDNDFIDAAAFESVGTPDVVDGGDGTDTCIVNENDTVEDCERTAIIDNP
jgi:Ca2+-binding RTX toxin-like protein